MCHGICKGRTHVGGVGTKLASVLGASHFFSFEVCRIKNNLRCARHRKYSRSESIEHTRHGFWASHFFHAWRECSFLSCSSGCRRKGTWRAGSLLILCRSCPSTLSLSALSDSSKFYSGQSTKESFTMFKSFVSSSFQATAQLADTRHSGINDWSVCFHHAIFVAFGFTKVENQPLTFLRFRHSRERAR